MILGLDIAVDFLVVERRVSTTVAISTDFAETSCVMVWDTLAAVSAADPVATHRAFVAAAGGLRVAASFTVVAAVDHAAEEAVGDIAKAGRASSTGRIRKGRLLESALLASRSL